MPRGRKLTPDEINEIRRLKLEGKKIKEIEEITGFSHTTIVVNTKDLQQLISSSLKPGTPSNQYIKIPPHQYVSPSQKKINNTHVSNSYTPSKLDYDDVLNEKRYQSPTPPCCFSCED
jgi:hypothetical protein